MSINLSLRKFVSPEIIFGIGARHLAGEYAKKFGLKKILLVTDSGIISTTWIDDINKSLDEAQIEFKVFSHCTPNPRESEVMEGAEFYKKHSLDGIIAIGGGSPMDLAKGIGIIVTNGGNILDYKGIDMIKKAIPPMIFIPTTAGTSADVSQFAIISDTNRLVKTAIVSKTIIPDIALIDSETTLTMNNYLTACTGMDALVHAIEAYVSKVSSPLTDIHALESIRVIQEYLPKVMKDPKNLDFRDKMMFASMEAGLAFSNAILGAVHAMAHSLGGLLDLPHGECNALLLDHVIDYNYFSVPDKYNKISEIWELNIKRYSANDKKIALTDKILEFKQNLGIVKTLRTCGVKETDIPSLSEKAMNDACMLTNPRESTKEDIEKIYLNAM